MRKEVVEVYPHTPSIRAVQKALKVSRGTISAVVLALVSAMPVHAADTVEVTYGDDLVGLLLVLVLSGLAYWHRDRLLYVVAGLGFLLIGVDYFDTNVYIGILLVVVGIYNFFKAAWDRH